MIGMPVEFVFFPYTDESGKPKRRRGIIEYLPYEQEKERGIAFVVRRWDGEFVPVKDDEITRIWDSAWEINK
jgi:hypothetical protein